MNLKTMSKFLKFFLFKSCVLKRPNQENVQTQGCFDVNVNISFIFNPLINHSLLIRISSLQNCHYISLDNLQYLICFSQSLLQLPMISPPFSLIYLHHICHPGCCQNVLIVNIIKLAKIVNVQKQKDYMGQFGQFGLNGFKQGQTHFSQLHISLDPDELES